MTEPNNTKERILDAAEHLFAQKGYHNTSLREITGNADANLASVNYHFGSKEKLIEAVMERRLIPLNQIRFERLDTVLKQAKAQDKLPEVREILTAFMDPTIRFLDFGTGGQDFSMIISRAHIDPDHTLRDIFLSMVKPLFEDFFQALCQALPNISKNLVFNRFLFALGAMGHALLGNRQIRDTGIFDNLTEGVTGFLDSEALIENLVDFVARGMEG